MLRALHSDPAIGLVGPCSNFVSGPQQVAVGYDSLADLDGFAWDWGRAHDGRRIEVNRLVGFCLLIRRAVVESVGLLDEQFGVGCFEDDDYCLRAIQAGYRAVIAADAFVHHFRGRTFVGASVDFGQIMREIERRFRAKWAGSGTDILPAPGLVPGGVATEVGSINGTPHPAYGHPLPARGEGESKPAPQFGPHPSPLWGEGGRRPGEGERAIASFSLKAPPSGGLMLLRNQENPRLSLCMIVRDSARTLPACLESIRPWVDENAGSRDYGDARDGSENLWRSQA